ncbi:hypothetical protein E4U41_005281 [Claviceps citrina]|nr:hypothetical protein E4U41_005281 [Claviceps citrina]
MSATAKAFYADLACAKKSQFDHASGIRRGDSDGAVTFKYSDSTLEEPLEIQVVATDLDSYPDGSSFMVFTSSDTCSANVVNHLEQLSATTRGCTLQGVIETISSRLASRLNEDIHDAESDSAGNGDAGHSEDEDTDMWLEDFKPIDVVDDEYFDVQPSSRPVIEAETPIPQDIDGLQRIQRELRASKLAGFHVGIYSLLQECPVGMVSLSIRASKLDIPSAAMSAWGLETTDYLVLLVKFLGPYPDLSALLSYSPRGTPVVFRFGKCKSPKPSIQCARMAFRPMQDVNDEPGPGHDSAESSEAQDKASFRSIYMSSTIDDLLNRRFSPILKIRRDRRCTWDMAQILLDRQEGGNADAEQQQQQQQYFENANCTEHEHQPPSSSNGPSGLSCDYSMEEDDEKMSFILVAMQFSLRRLRKCTEYCMVCHQRCGNEIGTLKPYVCSKSLCLYQYLSLAFGTSLEAEIVNSPYVVDLLITLFYAALGKTGQLREFPRGLALRAPHVCVSQDRIAINVCLGSKEFRVASSEVQIGEGEWVLVMVRTLQAIEKRVCRVSRQVSQNAYSFQEVHHEVVPSGVVKLMEKVPLVVTADDGVKEDWFPAVLLRYIYDPDDMERKDQEMSLRLLLDAMPSVLEVRRLLLESPGRKLGSWAHINRSALSLVRWIVASNTSYIVQDGAVLVVRKVTGKEGAQAAVAQEPAKPGMIQGLDRSWMQFRFAQGSPEKESAFAKAIESLCSTDPSKTEYPTLFAWHGSSLGNWHSIIRTGLDFSQVLNGRAFGHGVYLSKNMGVSRGYMGSSLPDRRATATAYNNGLWPKSGLRPKSALSICEIVNCPNAFVSRSPHFVIDKTEWIQCRYLLVQVDPTENVNQNPIFHPPPLPDKGYIKQDPENTIRGERGQALDIPITAISFAESRQRDCSLGGEGRTGLEPGSTEEEDEHKQDEGLDGSEDGDDPEALTDKIQAMLMATSRASKSRHSMTEAEDGAVPPAAEEAALSPSTFRPGALDLSTLPRLPDPAWAGSSHSALRALTREIRDLFKTQSQNEAATLGWYVDTAKVSNLFQWIVELHSFDADLPLARDMAQRGQASVVLEVRFGSNFPMSPPFVRVIRPRFLPFHQGGGGHVTAGGAICSEMLTSSGWSPAMSMENVFLQIRLALCDTERPARLDTGPLRGRDYGIGEAVEAYGRAARTHGWAVPQDVGMIERGWKGD